MFTTAATLAAASCISPSSSSGVFISGLQRSHPAFVTTEGTLTGCAKAYNQKHATPAGHFPVSACL